MQKKILVGVVVILAIVVIVLTVMAVLKTGGEEKLEGGATAPVSSPEQIAKIRSQEKIFPLPEGSLEEIQKIQNQAPIEVSYIFDITDTGKIGNATDFIIIGTVENIEGGTNYNPTTEKYTVAKTVGTIKVEKVLKGEIEEEIIPFIKSGGYIPFAEYKKVLKDSQTFEKMPQDDEYILQLESEDILLEQGKTYYMLLEYDTDFERYEIVFKQYGLREIDTSKGLNLKNNSKIKVKDNRTGSATTLSSILSQIEKVAEEESNALNGNIEPQETDLCEFEIPKAEEERGIVEQIKDFIILIVSTINNIILAFTI